MILFLKQGPQINWNKVSTRTHDMTDECFNVNYYGAKMMIQEFLPLLQLSDSARIVNVSSSTGLLKVKSNQSDSIRKHLVLVYMIQKTIF